MGPTESIEQAADYAGSALKLMAQLAIPATPANFTVWYAYHSGSVPGLTQALEILVSNKMEFTVERNQEIHDTYFGFDTEGSEIRETSERLQSAVGEVLEYLGEAGRDQSAYGEKLEGFSGQLAEDSDTERVADLVRGILSETQEIVEKSQALENRLDQSSQHIDELHRHLEEVRREAMTDALTGIANRKYFDAALRASAMSALESGEDLCLLLMDIDHFKRFNDTYGHLIGDEVLKVVARMLKDGVKGRDTPARYGGEEFAVILPETSLKNAVTVAEQIRQDLASREMKNKKTGKSFGTVTLSIGTAKYRPGETREALVQRADEALYRAKAEGRNKVVCEAAVDGSLVLPVDAA
jgi:diguanylate cyclase